MRSTAFQESVNSNIRAHNYEELRKSIYGLRDLYKLNGVSCTNLKAKHDLSLTT